MSYTLLLGDCIETMRGLPAGSVQTCVTSPPYYGLRSYLPDGHDDKHMEIGTEETPDVYVGRLVEVFRQVWRVLRSDGTVFLNLGDSYFGSNQTGGTNSKEGSAKRKGRMFSRPSSVQRADAYGTSGKALGDCQASDCLCGNLCDVCRVVYQSRKSRNDDLLVAMLTASLSAPNLGHTESGRDHLPTSDSTHQANRSVPAIESQAHFARLEGERLRASLVSMIDESSPRLLDVCLQRDSRSVCLLCARSLVDCVQGCVDRTACLCASQTNHLSMTDHLSNIDDNEATDGSLDSRRLGTAYDLAYPYYTTASRHGQLKPKDLIGIPWMVAFALRADGWYLRSEIIWHKKAPMPESVTDRPTKAHEQVFLLSKSQKYFYDADAVREPNVINPNWNYGSEKYKQHFTQDEVKVNGDNRVRKSSGPGWKGFGPIGADGNGRNKRSVWTLGPEIYAGSHYATMPTKLIEPCILAGTSAHGCCAKCGAPWARVTERIREHGLAETSFPKTDGLERQNGHKRLHQRIKAARAAGEPHDNPLGGSVTVGWQPTCTCNADVVSCTVLDPFFGSGTVGAVALKHGRNFIGIDIDERNIELAHERIRRSQPMLLEVI